MIMTMLAVITSRAKNLLTIGVATALCLASHSLALHTVTVFADTAKNRGTWRPIPDTIWQAMEGKSWHKELACPKRDELALLYIPYTNFLGEKAVGQMIVARSVADQVLDIFADIDRAGFPIEQMTLIYHFNGDDAKSMQANNTSAFNCRLKTSGNGLSQHSFGRAIDINPIQNPYVTRKTTLPEAGRQFDTKSERARQHAAVIRRNGAVVQAFEARGWKWGGKWRSLKDYQHFSRSGK